MDYNLSSFLLERLRSLRMGEYVWFQGSLVSNDFWTTMVKMLWNYRVFWLTRGWLNACQKFQEKNVWPSRREFLSRHHHYCRRCRRWSGVPNQASLALQVIDLHWWPCCDMLRGPYHIHLYYLWQAFLGAPDETFYVRYSIGYNNKTIYEAILVHDSHVF